MTGSGGGVISAGGIGGHLVVVPSLGNGLNSLSFMSSAVSVQLFSPKPLGFTVRATPRAKVSMPMRDDSKRRFMAGIIQKSPAQSERGYPIQTLCGSVELRLEI